MRSQTTLPQRIDRRHAQSFMHPLPAEDAWQREEGGNGDDRRWQHVPAQQRHHTPWRQSQHRTLHQYW